MSEHPLDLPEGSLGGNAANSFDIYVRMNDDPERDYCFNVNKDGE